MAATTTKNINIDLGLSALCDNADYGQTLPLQDIADVCQCSRAYVADLQKNAIKKLKRKRFLKEFLED